MAEIGIILLLFEVGLETDVRRLIRAGSGSLIIALTGFLLPFALGFGLGNGLLGMALLPALFVGGTLTATSISVTVRVLTDLGRQQSWEGQVVLGAAVLDDILGVVLLGLLYEFSVGGGVSIANAGKVMLFIGIFFALATPSAKLLSLVIQRVSAVSDILDNQLYTGLIIAIALTTVVTPFALKWFYDRFGDGLRTEEPIE